MKTDGLFSGFLGSGEGNEPDLKGNFERFLEHLERRREKALPVTIIIDGRETGVGKSALAICIARRLDPKLELANVVYSAQELYALYENRPAGSVALYDESVLGLLSRKGSRDEELTGLIGALSIVRKNGLATILCVPKIMMLDTIVRNGLAPHWIFVEARGRARVHRAHKGAHYRVSQPRLPYDLWTDVSPIGWRNLDRDPFFEEYKRNAIGRNRAYFHDQQIIAEVKRRRLLGQKPGDSTSEGNVSERALSTPTSTAPLEEIRCGRFTFRRKDAYVRHLTSRVHAEGCSRPAGSR